MQRKHHDLRLYIACFIHMYASFIEVMFAPGPVNGRLTMISDPLFGWRERLIRISVQT
jgi:hypothetical protein